MRPAWRSAPAMMAASFAAAMVVSGTSAQAQYSPPAWTRGATCYEVFVRSFYDSNGDGIGDIPGLIAKLDYINDGNPRSTRSLGARCIWLMPVAESPSYHGYDVTDYYRVNRQYGTNDDFKRLMTEAHRRGIKVLVDMVLNHVSIENPWFQAALRDTASPYRPWFRWSRTKPVEPEWGSEVWHHSPVRDEYYYGLFWSGMPDLNYTYPPVVAEANKVARFWLQDMGADGFRLDAVPYLVEEGTHLAHTPGTHKVLHDYEAYVRSVKPDGFTIGEVSYNNDVLLGYYPEQLDSYFAFEAADSLIAAVRRGSAKGLLSPVLRLQGDIPRDRWSPFLRNHDQPRTRTELGGDMARARIASFLLLTMPGVPFVYYGEEIGMIGSKPDERLRTPMQWTRGPGAGFTRGRPWERLADDSLTTTVEAQDKDPASLLQLHRRLIHLRDADAALATGELVPLTASDNAVAAYLRRDGDRAVLVIANLSRASLRGVSLTSGVDALRPGRWRSRNMLGGAVVASLRVEDEGRLQGYVPLANLAPLEGYLIELSALPSGRR